MDKLTKELINLKEFLFDKGIKKEELKPLIEQIQRNLEKNNYTHIYVFKNGDTYYIRNMPYNINELHKINAMYPDKIIYNLKTFNNFIEFINYVNDELKK